MNDRSDKKTAPAADRGGEFFNVGAPLHAVRPGYVTRDADERLYESAVAGQYAYVIAPDRTGKTSLIASASARLQNNGFKVAILDLEQIGERDGGSDAGRWYYSIAYRLLRQLRLKTDLQTWWQDNAILSNRQRLVEFLVQVVLPKVQERIVVFIDEIQCVDDLPFGEHLLASIRAAHNSRVTEPEFSRLTFVIAGECDPHSLVSDPQLSPFAVATEIRLGDFSREDLAVFGAELNLPPAAAERALDRIYWWTGGQPYLSQKLARAVAREMITDDLEEAIDRLARHQLAGRAALASEPHLSHLHRAVVSDRKNFERMLTVYGQVSKGIEVQYDSDSPRHRRLLALGLVVNDDSGVFRIRNRVYESVFTPRWANENLPFHWRGPAIAAALVLALVAIPFTYTQLLPKPYLSAISNNAYDLATISRSYESLRSFPGHQAAADRTFATALGNRARQADSRSNLREIAEYATLLPDGETFAGSLQAEFWDRNFERAVRNQNRDDALMAALESLSVSNPIRRRRAAALVGDDYPQLVGTVPAIPASDIVFNAEASTLTYIEGAEVQQWAASSDGVTDREPWTISALEVTPLLRRVIVDREGVAERIGLTINVSHPRLDDLRMRLIAPSGRATELSFDRAASAANELIRIPRGQLADLVGESLGGTWTLSLRDEATGVTGHLMSWSLSLNSQVVEEPFERGLDIPDPAERPSDSLWLSDDGRYAIARALQSDSARVWDLNFARATRTIAVPANERVVGISTGARQLVTSTLNGVTLWRTADGRRDFVIEFGRAPLSVAVTADGAHLLASFQDESDTIYEVWSLVDGTRVAAVSIAGAPALHSVDATATLLAVADYDRAVRVWDLRRNVQIVQFDLELQPTVIELAANGEALGALFGDDGAVVYRLDDSEIPVFAERSAGEWAFSFSPSGARFVAGKREEGVQAFRTADGLATGSAVDSGIGAGPNQFVRFNQEEDLLVAAGPDQIARFFRVPAVIADTGGDNVDSAALNWRESAANVTALSPGAERVAFGDRSGHVHIELIDRAGPMTRNTGDEVNFLGHQGAVSSVAFSNDGALVASVGEDNSVRIWDGHSGLPRPFYGRSPAIVIDRIAFSPSSAQVAILGGQRLWIMDTESGAERLSFDLGEAHADFAFVTDDQLYIGAQSGALNVLETDLAGNWHLRTVWTGDAALSRIAVADNGRALVVVDANHSARLLNLVDGQLADNALSLPAAVSEVAFSPNSSRVLFRTGRWIHRAIVAPQGLAWTDSIRAPKVLAGSAMAFGARVQQAAPAEAVLSGGLVTVLTRSAGGAELALLDFRYSDGPALFGSRGELAAEWSLKLRGPERPPFSREGL